MAYEEKDALNIVGYSCFIKNNTYSRGKLSGAFAEWRIEGFNSSANAIKRNGNRLPSCTRS